MLFWSFVSLAAFVSLNIENVQCSLSGMGNFPQYLTDTKRCRYMSVKRGYKRNRFGKVKELRVSEELECSRYCTKMADNCIGVNVETKAVKGLHLCEIFNEKPRDENRDLITNGLFNYIYLQEAIFSNCADIYKNSARESGVYSIRPTPSRSIPVYCDMVTSGGGWTVFQKRQDGSVDFYRDWADYKKGFGNKLGEYWLGLDTIHSITSQGVYNLRIDMVDFDGNVYYAMYDSFRVSDESDSYRLQLGSHTGNTFDAMDIHKGMNFSTWDRDNDGDDGMSCALKYKGAWWHNSCFHSNLNGLYGDESVKVNPDLKYLIWAKDKNSTNINDVLIRRVEMKMRPVNF